MSTAHYDSRDASYSPRYGKSHYARHQDDTEYLEVLMLPAALFKEAISHEKHKYGEERGHGCDHAKCYSEFYPQRIH